MIIREFSEHDIDEITTLMKKLCKIKGKDFNEDRWRRSLEKQMEQDTNTEVFVAFNETNNEILGMAYSAIKNSEKGFRFGYISNLIVREEKRRTGIGELLISHIIDYFKRNHINSVRIALEKNLDRAAKVLFTKLGFNEILSIYELQI
ncbi:MAG: GNAT family N-acetyltransferase [Candidatus Lokiarchaeota archaeon]